MLVHAINLIIIALWFLCGLVLAGIGAVDGVLASLMNSAGLPPQLQILLLGGVSLLLVIVALRRLHSMFCVLLLILLILLIVHKVLPDMHMPALPPGGVLAPGMLQI